MQEFIICLLVGLVIGYGLRHLVEVIRDMDADAVMHAAGGELE